MPAMGVCAAEETDVMGKTALMIDFGSTFTKAVVVDLETEQIVGNSQAPTTVESDIMIGLNQALGNIDPAVLGESLEYKLACSSAAGGLRMVAVGYVKELTAEAANMAALGAGAKVVDVFSYGLDDRETEKLLDINPDIILLAGGTDGGNKSIIIQNANTLARCDLKTPIVFAGNRKAAQEAGIILRNAGKDLMVTENVMPELNCLNVEPARKTIREIFMQRIIFAKGLDRAREFVDDILMPTPMALLSAASLLSDGTSKENGMGELVIVDVGGATTDVHSVAHGKPSGNAILKGLPEPYQKRTVEGDLGIRYNALHILERAGEEKILDNAGLDKSFSEAFMRYIERVSAQTSTLPANELETRFDSGITRTAVEIAVARHAGYIEEIYMSDGLVQIQKGKDLNGIKTVIGTGGHFVHSPHRFNALEGSLYEPSDPFSLRPKAPMLYADSEYILFSVGLLAEVNPDVALRIGKTYLKLSNGH